MNLKMQIQCFFKLSTSKGAKTMYQFTVCRDGFMYKINKLLKYTKEWEDSNYEYLRVLHIHITRKQFYSLRIFIGGARTKFLEGLTLKFNVKC